MAAGSVGISLVQGPLFDTGLGLLSVKLFCACSPCVHVVFPGSLSFLPSQQNMLAGGLAKIKLLKGVNKYANVFGALHRTGGPV